jgi:hypothetical protein
MPAQAGAAARVTTWETMPPGQGRRRVARARRAAPEKLANLPLLLVTKGRVRTPSGHEAKVAQEYFGRMVIRHAELAQRSSRGLHLVARSGHQMHMDDPDTVVAGVQAVLRAYRENRAVLP